VTVQCSITYIPKGPTPTTTGNSPTTSEDLRQAKRNAKQRFKIPTIIQFEIHKKITSQSTFAETSTAGSTQTDTFVHTAEHTFVPFAASHILNTAMTGKVKKTRTEASQK
jgi:hypothetical protein